jgi:4-amino-4-deoxy-L-arabinose transferase-like glycosyltransferase
VITLMWIVATALVVVCAALLAAMWPGLTNRLDRVLAWALLVPSLITVLTLVLGLAGRLSPWSLLLGQALLTVVTLVVWWRSRKHRGRPVVAESRGLFRRVRAALREPWTWPLIVVWVLALVWVIYVGLIVPPYGWDGLSYHVPPAVWWLQSGRIYSVPSQFRFGYSYPQGMSILLLWQLAFTSSDHLMNLVQVPFAVLGAVAAYGLAREAGIGRRWAIWASLFWGLAPLVVAQSTVPYNDVAVAALTITGLYFGLRAARAGRSHVWLAGVAGGLIMGMKPNGVLTVAIFAAVVLFPVRRPVMAYVGEIVKRAVAIAVPCLLLAGYWYIRNVVLYQNPIWPLRVSLFGHLLFPGPNKSISEIVNVTPDQTTWQTFLFALKEHISWYSYDHPNGGLGPILTCMGIAAILAVLLHSSVRKRWRVSGLILCGVAMLLLQPFKYPRYVLLLPALGGLSFAYVLQHLATRPLRHLFQAAAVLLMLYTVVMIPYQPQLSAETFWEIRTATANGETLSSGGFAHAGYLAFITSTPELVNSANRIAYTGFSLVYPLMGPGRENRIYYVPAVSEKDWLDAVMKARTTFVLIGNRNTAEMAWVKKHPETFILWAGGYNYWVYLVRSDEPRNQLLRQEVSDRGVGK